MLRPPLKSGANSPEIKELNKHKEALLQIAAEGIGKTCQSHNLPADLQTKIIEQTKEILNRTLQPSFSEKKTEDIKKIIESWENVVTQFINNIKLLLGRINNDYELLCNTFLSAMSNPKLTNIIFTDSDPHKRGKTVVILEFQSESKPEKIRVVYKPSPVQMDAMIVGNLAKLRNVDPSFKNQQSMAEIFNRYSQHTIPTYLVVPRTDHASEIEIDNHYGYIEFIEQNPAFKLPNDNLSEISQDEVAKAYRTHLFNSLNNPNCDFILRSKEECDRYSYVCGLTTALVLAVGGSDMHYENMIIRQRLPCLIDLECSLNPTAKLDIENTGLITDSSGKCAFEPYARRDVPVPGKLMLELPEKNLIYFYDLDRQILKSYAPDYTKFREGLVRGFEIIAMTPVLDWFSQEKVTSLKARFIPISTQEFLRMIARLAKSDYSAEAFKSEIVPAMQQSLGITDEDKRMAIFTRLQELYKELSAHSVPWYYLPVTESILLDFNSHPVTPAGIGQTASYFSESPIANARKNCEVVQQAQKPGAKNSEAKQQLEHVEEQCRYGLARVNANNDQMPFLIDVAYFTIHDRKIAAIQGELPLERQKKILADFVKECKELVESRKQWYSRFFKPAVDYSQVDIDFHLANPRDLLLTYQCFVRDLAEEKEISKTLTPERRKLIEDLLKIVAKYNIVECGKKQLDINERIDKAYEEMEKHYKEVFKIRTRDYSDAHWRASNIDAIKKLTRSPCPWKLNDKGKPRPMTLYEAIDEIVGLEWHQVRGVANGLRRSDVLGLNQYEIGALVKLIDLGLTAQQLREYRSYSTHFNEGHQNGLIYLMRESKVSANDALLMLKGIHSAVQADGFCYGLSVHEVNTLNDEQIKTYRELKSSGLTPLHLLNWRPPQYRDPEVSYGHDRNDFTSAHRYALDFLLNEIKLNPAKAFEQIDRINSQQAFALKELYRHGIRGEHLRNWKGDEFTYTHRDMLIDIVQNQRLSGDKAMDELYSAANNNKNTLRPS